MNNQPYSPTQHPFRRVDLDKELGKRGNRLQLAARILDALEAGEIEIVNVENENSIEYFKTAGYCFFRDGNRHLANLSLSAALDALGVK